VIVTKLWQLQAFICIWSRKQTPYDGMCIIILNDKVKLWESCQKENSFFISQETGEAGNGEYGVMNLRLYTVYISGEQPVGHEGRIKRRKICGPHYKCLYFYLCIEWRNEKYVVLYNM
jgi:hypothetical protein